MRDATAQVAARRAGGGSRAARAARAAGGMGSSRRATVRRAAPPLEHRILMTATLCLLAFGAVMVYSASSPLGTLGPRGGSGMHDFIRYIGFGSVGLVAMLVLERYGLALLTERRVRLFLVVSMLLVALVLVPGFGVEVQGGRRWLRSGPFELQPSELVKLALVLYAAGWIAAHPRRLKGRLREAIAPIALVTVPALALIALEPDMGTAIAVALPIGALLLASGIPVRRLGLLAAIGAGCVILLALARHNAWARLTSFLHPWAVARSTGFQEVQGQIAVGSGGVVGVGLGNSVQKIYYLPEAQNDFILAVIGEELGVLGIAGVVALYGMIAYAGLHTARRAAGRYAKLLATGLTSLILCQGILNLFVVLGLAPLTGVPLPFISYAPTNLCVMLASVGLLLNIARPGPPRLRIVRTPPRDRDADRDRRRRDRRARGSGTGGGRRPAS